MIFDHGIAEKLFSTTRESEFRSKKNQDLQTAFGDSTKQNQNWPIKPPRE